MDGMYPIVDRVPVELAKRIGLSHAQRLYGPMMTFGYKDLRAIPTAEKRPPKKGELYLSGSPIGGYFAPNDLTIPFRIAKLVRISEKVVVTVEEVFDIA